MLGSQCKYLVALVKFVTIDHQDNRVIGIVSVCSCLGDKGFFKPLMTGRSICPTFHCCCNPYDQSCQTRILMYMQVGSTYPICGSTLIQSSSTSVFFFGKMKAGLRVVPSAEMHSMVVMSSRLALWIQY